MDLHDAFLIIAVIEALSDTYRKTVIMMGPLPESEPFWLEDAYRDKF